MTVAVKERTPQFRHGSAHLWFRFADDNPCTGLAYWASRFDDLPYAVSLVVERQLGLSPREWDDLVAEREVAERVDCHGLFRLPLVLDRPLGSARTGVAGVGVCPDCWGTCEQIDTDGSLTGTVGAALVCSCSDGFVW
ncbi:hypothetical protein [Allokutzneria oryzae]|uniref:Uncharacterized protein n=1 Tax=Allokutzneria oryzae TaxID=1378989 RepID=A0ABV6A4I7_9PSEU